MSVLTLRINDQPVAVQAGSSLLSASRAAGVELPVLCHLDGLTPVGACRLCLVEIEGGRRLLPACTTEAVEGMVVRTDTPQLREFRRMAVELFFAEGNHVLDHNRCILCSRCVRVCDEIEGAHVWDVAGRGSNCRIIAGMDEPWGEVEACTSCGKCVDVCPTGALFHREDTTSEKRSPGEWP